jgi:hypothetical protein
MSRMKNHLVIPLIEARNDMRAELNRLDAAIHALGGKTTTTNHTHVKRHLSKAARERISEAQRERWAKTKREQRKGEPKSEAQKASPQATYWGRMTPAQRRKEMKRRGMLKTKKAA